MKKRCLSLLLALVLTAGLGSAAACMPAAAVSLSDIPVADRLAAAEAVWSLGAVYVDSWDDGCTTCYGFVRELFRYVFGTALPTIWRTSDARFEGDLSSVVEIAHADNYSVAQLKSILAMAMPGDVLIATTGSGNHGVIVRSAESDGSGVYVFDANWSKNEAGEPLIRTNAWWSAEDIQRTRPGAVTLYRFAGNTGSAAGSAGDGGMPGAAIQTAVAGFPSVSFSSLAAPAGVRSDRQVYGPKDSIRFSWDAVPGATAYSVALWKDSAELYTVEVGDNCSFTTAPLAAGNYMLIVNAGNSAGYSPAGTGCAFTVTGETSESGVNDDGAPAPVAGLSTEKTSYTTEETILVSWKTAHGAESYRLYLERDDGARYYVDAEEGETSLRLPALAEGVYTLTVLASSPSGSAESTPYRITVGDSAVVVSDVPLSAAGAGGTEEVHFAKAARYAEGQFQDVASNAWYASSVASAYELGLMGGDGDDATFNPDGEVTVLQAIIMACRIHSIYATGAENFEPDTGAAWYKPYLDYAYANGIITAAVYGSKTGREATRTEFAKILALALPEEALAAINDIADGAIPDVAMTADGSESIYRLYRAGILTGDESGAFQPGEHITRAAAAAIVSRMAESDKRERVSL